MKHPLLYLVLAMSIPVLSNAAEAPPASSDFPSVEQLPVIKGLPDPFLFNDGSRVKTREDWPRRRAEIQAAVLYYEYGQMPPAPGNTAGVELVSSSSKAGPGAVHKVIKISCGPERKISFTLDLTIPKGKGPFPVIVCGDMGWDKVQDEVKVEAIKRGYIIADRGHRCHHEEFPVLVWATLHVVHRAHRSVPDRSARSQSALRAARVPGD